MYLITSLLQDIPTFDGWNTTKLEGQLSDTKRAANILKESHACPDEAKSHSLTYTFVCKAIQAGKCWDDIRDILHLKLCNANIHTYTSCFMENQQRGSETLAAYYTSFLKWKPRDVISTVTPPPLGITQHQNKGLWKGLSDHNGGHQTSEKLNMAQQITATLSSPYGGHDVEWWQMFCIQQDSSYW